MSDAIAKHLASLTIAEMREEIEGFREQAEGYRKALEQIRDSLFTTHTGGSFSFHKPEGTLELVLKQIERTIAKIDEALSDAKATAQETIRQLTHKLAEAENTIGELRIVGGEQVETIRQWDEEIQRLQGQIVKLRNSTPTHDTSCKILREREPVPEAGDRDWTPEQMAVWEADRKWRDAAQETIRLKDQELTVRDSKLQACEIAITNLKSVVESSEDHIRQRDERIKELRGTLTKIADYEGPDADVYVIASDALEQDAHWGSKPPALCPTCKGTKTVSRQYEDDGPNQQQVMGPCPTCAEPK